MRARKIKKRIISVKDMLFLVVSTLPMSLLYLFFWILSRRFEVVIWKLYNMINKSGIEMQKGSTAGYY